MKHRSTNAYFAYWDGKRAGERAPDRGAIEPGEIRELLGDIFVLSYDTRAGFPFRVAGTRVCALFGRDLKDKSFLDLFTGESRREMEDIATIVAEETLGALAGVTARTPSGGTAHLELLLLPFNTRAHMPVSMTGLLAPFETNLGLLGELELTSHRYLHQQEKIVPRALRKLALARGFMVYEGLR
jgi:hypothetical protein